MLETTLTQAVHEFNTGLYFECHETLEAEWLKASGEDKLILQGLIQLAAAMIKWRDGNHYGASRLIQSALEKLSPRRHQWNTPLRIEFPELPSLVEKALAAQNRIGDRHPFITFQITLAPKHTLSTEGVSTQETHV